MAKGCVTPKIAKWMIGVASVFLVLSITALGIFPIFYQQQLKKFITLSEGSLTAKKWGEVPFPLHQKLYFFNITNADAFLNNKEPLNVTEVGPYVYIGRSIKHNPKWHPNGTVSYRDTRTWHFEPDMSVGSQDDYIYTLNGPMIIGASILKKYSILMRMFYYTAMNLEKEAIVIHKRIRDLAYDGYKDPIIEYAPLLKPNIPYKNGTFMWLNDKNDTDDGEFTAFTGADDQSLTNVISHWNGKERMNFWKGDSCNMLNGTNAQLGPPLPEKPDSYTFFQSIFCRLLTFDYTGDTISYGIPLKRFRPSSMVFANSTMNPENACYEVNGERLSGVLDVSPCLFGAPALISFPHFYMADPSYVSFINGLNPKSNIYDSHIDVEPITGFTMNISVKFQLNLKMERVEGMAKFTNVPEGVFPIFWADINLELNEDFANNFKGQLNNPKYMAYGIFGFLLITSLAVIIWGVIIITLSKKDDNGSTSKSQDVKMNSMVKGMNTRVENDYGDVASNLNKQSDEKMLKQTDSYFVGQTPHRL